MRALRLSLKGSGFFWVQVLQYGRALPLATERMARVPNIPLLISLSEELARDARRAG